MYSAVLYLDSTICCKTYWTAHHSANDPKYTAKATQELPMSEKWDILQWRWQSYDLNPTEGF